MDGPQDMDAAAEVFYVKRRAGAHGLALLGDSLKPFFTVPEI